MRSRELRTLLEGPSASIIVSAATAATNLVRARSTGFVVACYLQLAGRSESTSS